MVPGRRSIFGSSAAKTVVLQDGEIWKTMEMATGFSNPGKQQMKDLSLAGKGTGNT